MVLLNRKLFLKEFICLDGLTKSNPHFIILHRFYVVLSLGINLVNVKEGPGLVLKAVLCNYVFGRVACNSTPFFIHVRGNVASL